MTHPDIIEAQRLGYPEREFDAHRPFGVCLFCGSDIYHDGNEHYKSFDGVFCDRECCRSYYEIAETE